MSKKYVTDKIQIINNSNGIEFLKDDGVSIVLKIDASYTNTDSGLTYWNDTTKSYETDSNLTYNPSTGQLSATSFSGTFSGSAISLKSVSTSGVMTIVGPSDSTTRQKTIRDANDTILELGGSYTPTGNWVWTSGTHTWPTFNQNTTGSAGSVSNSVTFNNGGAGGASGSSFNGSSALTVSYNTIGAAASSHSHNSDYVSKTTIGTNSFVGEYLVFTDISESNRDYISYNNSTNAFYFNADTTLTNTTANANIYANSFVKQGGTSSQFLKADGSVDSTAYTTNTGTVTSVAAGNGMNFTTITGSGSVTMGTPGSLTASTTNAVTSTSHTHNVTGFLVTGSSTQTGYFGTIYASVAIDLADNDVLRFGSSDDWRLFHSSSNNYMDLYVGNLYIREYTTSAVSKFLFTRTTGDFHAVGDLIAYSTSVSDERLKENIKKLETPLDKVLKLQGVNFEWIDGYKDNVHIGYIAQEVEKIIPEVVIDKYLMKFDGDYKTIRYEEIIPYLSEAIKEQQNIINGLKEELNILKNKIK